MLYSFIPPILIILSVIGIIIFLVKKSSDIRTVAREENETRSRAVKNPSIANGEKIHPGGSPAIANGRIKRQSLIALEKFTRRLKIIFLRLENTFSSWSDNLRKKRTSDSQTSPDNVDARQREEKILRKIANYPVDESRRPSGGKRQVFEKEKAVRPMISDEVITPKMPAQKKNRLESILIERIAANPKDIEAYERLGEYYFEIGNYDHAKECYKQVMKLDPGSYNAKNKMRKLERILQK